MGPWGDGDDLALVTRAAAGDGEAFARLYDRHAGWVYSRLRYDLGNDAEARDATQEVFLEVWRDLPQQRDPQALPAWLRTVATRRAMKVKRARAARPDTSAAADDELDRAIDPAAGPEDDAVQGEARQLVADGLVGLHPRYRQVVELRMLHGQAGSALESDLGVTGAQASRLADKALHGLADSIRALVVARQGRRSCDGLDRLLAEAGWIAGPLTPELRNKVQRHVGRCPTCQDQRRGADRLVLESLPMLIPFALPAGLREGVLHEAARLAATQPAPPPTSSPPASSSPPSSGQPGQSGQSGQPSGPPSGQEPPSHPVTRPRLDQPPSGPAGGRPGPTSSTDRALKRAVAVAAALLLLLLAIILLRPDGDDPPVAASDAPSGQGSDDGMGPKAGEGSGSDDGPGVDGDGDGSGCPSYVVPPDDALEVLEQGFGVTEVDGHVSGSYGFVVENTTGGPITDLAYTAVFLDGSCSQLGGVVDTVVNQLEVIPPGERFVGGQGFTVPYLPLTTEDFVTMQIMVWPANTLDRGPAPDGAVTVSGVTTEVAGDEIVTNLTASSSYSVDIVQLLVHVIYRDAEGNILGGVNMQVTQLATWDPPALPAGGTVPVTVTAQDVVADPSAIADTEVSAVPDYVTIT